jgi:hypothetical protein
VPPRARFIHLGERREDPLLIGGRNPDARIDNGKSQADFAVARQFHADLQGDRSFIGEFESVRD